MTVNHNPSKQRFEIVLDNGTAVLDYDITGDRIVFTHTGVPEAHEGKGVTAALVKHGLAWARQQGLVVVAQCSYVRAYLRRHPEALA